MALEIPVIGSANAVADPKTKTNFETLSALLGGSNKIKGAGIEASTIEASNLALGNLGRFYAPKVIATEQTRESTSFGTLTTADEVTGVVLPENGLIMIGYRGIFKSSVAAAGRVAIFIGATQLKFEGTGVETATAGTENRRMSSEPAGIALSSGGAAFGTTGEPLVAKTGAGGFCAVFAAAGTYAISVQYKATSGNVTAKERALVVGVVSGV